MSGIGGIHNLDGRPIEREALERMTEAAAHRGPDGAGVWLGGSIGLGHRLLHSTPESVWERSPTASRDADLVITADARLDNREELIAALDLDGGSITDPELILAAHERWGEDCPARLIGDFAFAIWDGRRRRLFCARDPVGIKPLYYWSDDRRVLIASEIRQIVEVLGEHPEPNRRTLAAMLLDRVPPPGETLYEGIRSLRPGHLLTAENAVGRERQYDDLWPASEVRHRTEEEYVEHFRELFAEAVRSRLRSNGPVAVLLSGGLDSSAIACQAQELGLQGKVRNGGLETYSLVFDSLPCDERRYIEEVVRKWGLPTNYFAVESESGWLDFGRALECPDLLYCPNHYMMLGLLAQARQRGVKVGLWGIGGDDLLASGFYYLTDLARSGRWLELLRELLEGVALYECRLHGLIRDYCLAPLIPRRMKAWLRRLWEPWSSRRRAVSWIDRNLAAEARQAEPLRCEVKRNGLRTHVQRAIHHGLRWGRLGPALAQVDLLGSRFGMEFRHPFCDRRIIEFVLGLPPECIPRLIREKDILRRALREILPDAVRDRKDKTDFTPCAEREFRYRQADKVEALIRSSRLAHLGLVNRQRLYNVFDGYRRAGSPDGYLRRAIQAAVAAELWWRTREKIQSERRRRDGSESNGTASSGGEATVRTSNPVEVW